MGPISTQISAVTLFPDRARVSRRGRLSLQPGLQRLEVAGLPIHLLADSVRASARGSARARLFGVQVQPTFFVDPQIEQVFHLESQLEQAQDDLQRVDAQIGLVKQQRENLSAVMGQSDTFAIALAAGEMDLARHLELMDGLRARAEALETELTGLAVRRREAERNLQKIRSELDRWRGLQGRELYTAAVEVEVLEPGELELDLSYVVMGAGWRPLYDIRLIETPENEQLELDYTAQITQTTGEDWSEVDLTLSTARPALAGRLPELDPWFVRPQPVTPPPQPLAAPAPRMARMMSKVEMPEAMEAMPYEAEVQTATVESGGAAVTYRAAGRVNVPSDGAPHKVTVARLNLAPRLDYVTAPRLTESVYRRAKVLNDSPYTLLPGSLNLFAGDEFIGTARLELISPQQEMELYLGVDDRLKVERELKRREVDKRLIGNRRRTVYGYEITLENLTTQEVRLTLHEGIPVSRSEEIKVRLDASEPKPSQQDELNRLDWHFTLAAQEKRVVRYDFSVEFPVSMQVIGLP